MISEGFDPLGLNCMLWCNELIIIPRADAPRGRRGKDAKDNEKQEGPQQDKEGAQGPP
jgi:hypothetical protein